MSEPEDKRWHREWSSAGPVSFFSAHWLIFIETKSFQPWKIFSRIELGGGCVLRGKLAAGSVRSQKPRIMPLQTTHKTSIHPRQLKILPSENPQGNHSAPISGQASTLLFSKISSYLPYFSFPYRSIHRKIIPVKFHKITGIKLNNTP